MIQPYQIRKCSNFNEQETIKIYNEKNSLILEMKPSKEIFINGSKEVIPFNCQFNKNITKTIMVEEQLYEGYTIPNSFKAYFFKNENIIFFNCSKTITNEFIKKINTQNSVEFEKINFNLKAILSSEATKSKGMHFKYADANVRSKSVHGNNVEKHKEAETALKQGDVTYAIITMDIPFNGQIRQHTVNLSVNSSIAVLSKCETDEQYLELVYNTYLKISELL